MLGFLYQLQATAARLIDATLTHTGLHNSVNSIQAILEPASGGDAIVEAGERHCIQLKLRSKAIDIGTLADSVLPDLFGAHCELDCEWLELQSNQTLTKPAANLFSFLQGDGLATAATQRDCERAKDACLFIFVGRKGTSEGFEEAFETFSCRLHLAPPIDAVALRERLLQHLYPNIPYGDQVEAKLDQLTGKLLELASKNGNVVTGAAIAEMLGFTTVTDAQARLSAALRAALDARQYDVAHDVRLPLSVSAIAKVNLIAGPSGNGKSWALCRLAQQALENNQPALLVRASDRAELDREMKRLVAIEALNHESPIEPSALGKLWRRHNHNDEAGILVLWEGCRNADELKQAIYHGGLGEGFNLVAELPPEADTGTFRDVNLMPHEIGEFRETELFEALSRRDINAGMVPATIRRMLRHPVLCGLYAQLARDGDGWNPANEYLVLQQYWNRARSKAGPTAGARLKALAKKMVAKAAGEVSDSEILELGFTDEQLAQLVASGWLAQLSGKWRFAHDRLLTWAIAEWLAERFNQPNVGADDLAAHIETLQNDSPEDPSRLHGLGFLMMDILWLAASGNAPSKKLADLMAFLENDRQNRSSQSFYRELCPTVGPAIVDGLIARAALVTNRDSDSGIAGNIASAIHALNLPQATRDTIVRRLIDGDDKAWKLLLLLGSKWPLPAQSERMWDGLVETYRHIGTEQRNFAEFERYREATLCLCSVDPAWLETKILSTTDATALGIATGLLREIVPAPEPAQWHRISSHLFQHMHPDDHARLIGFVRRVDDQERIPFLIDQIEKASYSAPDALAALAQMAPAKALEIIANRPALRYPPQAGIWLHRLLDHAAAQARDLIDIWLMQIDPTGCMLASLWSGAKTDVGPTTIAILLCRLDEEMAQEEGGDDRTLRVLLGVLGSAKLDPVVDESCHTMRGGRLATNLRVRLKGHANGAQCPLAEEIWTLLQRIGGEDFEAYVNDLLDGPTDLRGFGVGSAVFAPTASVVDRLETMAADWSVTYPEQLRKTVWRILINLKPDIWYSRMLALLTARSNTERALGIELFDDLGFVEDASALVDCVRLTEPGSALEARVINLAVHYDARDSILLERALPRFNKEADAEGHLAACNVLLKERGATERALLDNYLLEFTKKTSWSSTDMQLLSIRLHQDDVPDNLLSAAEPFMQHRSFFGESVIQAYLDRGHTAVRDIVIERAFSSPSIFTNEQPDMIDALARYDVSAAEEAFEQAWVESPKRQRYLVPCSRKLGTRALEAMLKCLPSKEEGQDAEIAFRAMSIEFRRRHEEALPIIRAQYAAKALRDREPLIKIISWLPEAEIELQRVVSTDPDPDTRELAEELLLLHHRRAAAVDAYRAKPSSTARLQYVMEIVDPEMLYRLKDEWSISQLIEMSGQQTVIAEDTFVRRFNNVAKTRLKRARIRPRTRKPLTSDDD